MQRKYTQSFISHNFTMEEIMTENNNNSNVNTAQTACQIMMWSEILLLGGRVIIYKRMAQIGPQNCTKVSFHPELDSY